VSRAIRHKLRWSYEKRRCVPPSETKKRSAFHKRLKGIDPRRPVFVDESSTNVALTTRYARAPKGERPSGKAPRNWGKNVTLISSISTEGMGPVDEHRRIV
jgi:hypothetical protein